MINDLNRPALRYLASVISRDDGKSFIELEFRTIQGTFKVQLYERSLLANPTALSRRLLDDGIEPIDPKVVAAAISTSQIEVREVTRRPGWHGDSFVYPGQTFGNANLTLIPSNAASGLGKRKGSLQKWRRGIRKAVKYSDVLLLAACLAPASSLLDVIGMDEGVVFHLHGTDRSSQSQKKNSTAGKTTAARLAISLTGSSKTTDLGSYRFSPRGLEEYLVAHNHLVAAFDEEGAGSVTSSGHQMKRSELAYNIPSGVGIKRAGVATKSGLPNELWSLVAISNGELPIDQTAIARKEGDQVRMISLPVAPGGEGGIFNRLNKFKDEIDAAGGLKTIIREFEKAIDENYGVAMPEFLASLVPNRTELRSKIEVIIDQFVTDVCGPSSEPWDRRFAKRFAIVFAAAVLMARHGVGPWSERRARAAMKRLHNHARNALRSPHAMSEDSLRILRKEIKDGRFPLVKKGSEPPHGLKSFARKRGGKKLLCIKMSDLRQLLGDDYDPIIGYWRNQAIVMPSADGKLTQQIKIAGQKKRERFVVIDRDKFGTNRSD